MWSDLIPAADKARASRIVRFVVQDKVDDMPYEIKADRMDVVGGYVRFYRDGEFHRMVFQPLDVIAVRHGE